MSRNLIDRENLKIFLLLGKYETIGDIIKFIDRQRVFTEESRTIQEKQAESEKYQKAFDDGYANGYSQARFDYESKAESEDKDCKEIVSFIMKEKYKRRNEKLVVLINKDIERKVKNLIVEWKENYTCLISHNRTLCGLPIVVMEVNDVKVVTFEKYKEMAESER